jgi:hypothetical protein
VPAQELHLVGAERLEARAEVGLEVGERVADQLAARRRRGHRARRAGRGHRVGLADGHQQRAADLRGVPAGPVERHPQRDPRGHLVAPHHPVGHQVGDRGPGAGPGDHRPAADLPGHRHQHGRAPEPAPHLVAHRVDEQARGVPQPGCARP